MAATNDDAFQHKVERDAGKAKMANVQYGDANVDQETVSDANEQQSGVQQRIQYELEVAVAKNEHVSFRQRQRCTTGNGSSQRH